MEENNIDLRSEEFQEILGDVPSWILRRGMWVLAITVVILLTGSAFFKYPEIISSEMQLTGTTPPAKIVANTTGKLRELYVVDNQIVKSGTCIGVIDNPANTKDVVYLKGFIRVANFMKAQLSRQISINNTLDFVLSGKFDPTNLKHVSFVTALKE